MDRSPAFFISGSTHQESGLNDVETIELSEVEATR